MLGGLDWILVSTAAEHQRERGRKNGFPQLILPALPLEIVCKLATVTCSLSVLSFLFSSFFMLSDCSSIGLLGNI